MAFSMLAKLFNFGQSLAASYAFGVQVSTDILFYLLSMLILLSTMLSAVNQQVIVPNVIYLKSNKSEQDSVRFISYIYFLYMVLGIIATAALMMWPEKVLELFSRFRSEYITSNMDIVRFIMPAFILIVLNTFILDIFTAYRYFTLPMILDMLKNLVIILFVLLFKDVFSVASLAMGVLVGNILQFVLLNYLLFAVLKCKPAFKRYPLENTIKKNIVFVVVGHLTTFIGNFLVMYLMSGFSAGIYSALDYSQKINTVFNLVIIGQISTVIGMNIIEIHAKGNFERLNDTFVRYLKTSLFFIIPFSFMIALNAEGIISLFFERGRFTRQSVELTGNFLRLFILTLPYMLINAFVVRLIIAKQIQRIAFWWQISQSGGNVLVLWIMINSFGYMGYPVGSIIANYIYVFLLLYFLLKHQFPYIDYKGIIRYSALNILLNSGIAAAFYWFGWQAEAGGSFIEKVMNISCISIAFFFIYVLLSYVTGVNRIFIKKLIMFSREA